ncbi:MULTISPECIES: SRPBCC family protein [Roseomonadaceae]|uniref:SRPBCC family protein n=1 Tax=Falsiroseomonas oleicola TaxID=2801474 RepID=A0ABS6H7K2_9PROT|nr:SRPBCC family protein [Roseomonas oleicola]MBU8543807.1 SRPBCC family protein [Roseomonas oleicola]
MKFTNHFEVPLPPDEAWALLLDVQRIAPCVPGAELTEVIDERSFKGRVSVKLGPVALTFAGTARFETIDEAARSATVKAQGTDAKGRGGANAVATFALSPIETGTRVDIATDLNLSGSVAQYGRGAGMIQEVASQIIRQFAEALRADIARRSPAPAAADAPPPPPPPPAAPIGGFGLLWRAFLAWLRRATGR